MSCRLCTSRIGSPVSQEEREEMALGTQNRASRVPPSSFWIRVAMRISRSRWFSFMRRVFHYQNGSRSELGPNPFNSRAWMMIECAATSLQLFTIVYTLSVSKVDRPVWVMRIWLCGYALGCFLSLVLLYCRFRLFYATQGDDISLPDIEQQSIGEEFRSVHCFYKCRTSAELFFAIWFIVGNVWAFDYRLGSPHHDPKVHKLCIILLAWNAISYSFPFILFVLLCCCVPLFSHLLGYNMTMGSINRGATDEQLSRLANWRYKNIDNAVKPAHTSLDKEKPECCICLAKYRENDEIRQLPCSHIFHLKCVDQWLSMISCCPLCKQALQR